MWPTENETDRITNSSQNKSAFVPCGMPFYHMLKCHVLLPAPPSVTIINKIYIGKLPSVFKFFFYHVFTLQRQFTFVRNSLGFALFFRHLYLYLFCNIMQSLEGIKKNLGHHCYSIITYLARCRLWTQPSWFNSLFMSPLLLDVCENWAANVERTSWKCTCNLILIWFWFLIQNVVWKL